LQRAQFWELREGDILLKTRLTVEEVLSLLGEHRLRIRSFKIKGSVLGELRGIYQEIEYEEAASK
jgi:hypothetical protein